MSTTISGLSNRTHCMIYLAFLLTCSLHLYAAIHRRHTANITSQRSRLFLTLDVSRHVVAPSYRRNLCCFVVALVCQFRCLDFHVFLEDIEFCFFLSLTFVGCLLLDFTYYSCTPHPCKGFVFNLHLKRYGSQVTQINSFSSECFLWL